jgi:hypothetical protein
MRRCGAAGLSVAIRSSNPQYDVAVALAWPAHRAEPIDPDVLEPDGALGLVGDLGFDAHGTERERLGDRLEGGGGYGVADHVDAVQPSALPNQFDYLSTISIACSSAAGETRIRPV